jgi:branched-chain amino acid transport system substrate-binding protein
MNRWCVSLSLLLTICLISATGTVLAQVKEVKVGGIFPLTGSLASTGDEIRAGIQLAEDVINNGAPGVDLEIAKWKGIPSLGNAKIKYLLADHRGDPTRGADLARRLIDDDKVAGILGSWMSSVTMSVSAITERQGIAMLNSDSSSPGLVRRGFKWFWHANLHVEMFAGDVFKMLDYMVKEKIGGVQSKADLDGVAVLAENTEWGTACKGVLEKAAKEYGYKLVEVVTYSHRAPDLSSEVQKVMAAKPNVVIMASYVSDAILFTKTFKSMKFAPKVVMGFDGGFAEAGYIEALGDDANGTMVIDHFFLSALAKAKPVTAKINEMYKQRAGKDLTTASALGFTGAQIWAHVLNKAGKTDPAAVQKAFNELDLPGREVIMPWSGVKFESFGGDTGQNRKVSAAVTQIQNGIRQVVYPGEMGTAKMVYPFPQWK